MKTKSDEQRALGNFTVLLTFLGMKTTLSCGRLFLTFAHYHLAALSRPHECMKCMHISVCGEDRCAGRRGRSHPELRTRPRPARSTPRPSAPAQPRRRRPRLPRETTSAGSQASLLFLRLLLVLGPWLAWREVRTPWKIRRPLKGRPRRSAVRMGLGREGLVGLSGVCRVRGAVSSQSSQSALSGPFLVGYDEISFPFLMASLLALTHLLARIVSM